jgi:hypothetical protein
MKSVHNKSKQPKYVDWKFPCLGLDEVNGDVVVFTMYGKGMVVSPVFYRFGHHVCTWEMSDFKPLPSTESITLSND